MRGKVILGGCAWAFGALGIAVPVAAQETARSTAAGDASGEIVVTGSVYRGNVATGGARIDVPIKDLPLSISVVTEALAKDRQVRNVRELAENVAGVRARTQGSGAFSIDFSIRGLQGGNGSVVAVNGFRMENFSAGFDPQAVERVEFLKGPASVLYGASGALSGLVNIVTKTPRRDDFLIADLTGGDPTYARATIDFNVRLSDTLESRTNLAITHERVINAFRAVDEQFAMQSLRWHPGNLNIIVEGSYFHAIGPSRESTSRPMLSDFFALPNKFKTGERWDRNINTGYTGRFDGTWQVTPNLSLRQGVSYQRYRELDYDVANYTADTFQALIAPGLLGRSLRRGDGKVEYVISQTEARWNFAIGPTRHKLLAGFEYGDEKFGGICCSRAPIAPLNLANPSYGAPEPTIPLTDYFNNTIRTKAMYLQDYVEWGQLRLLAGLRRDDTTSTSGYCSLLDAGCPTDPIVANLGSAQKVALSPRVGMAWLPNDRTTLYASWSRSFFPNVSLDRNNRLLPPEYGTQYEVGLRQELATPGRLTLSLAAFQLQRRNISSCDPTIPDCSRSIAIGAQRIRGAEAELAGKPTNWIDMIATLSYLDGKVTESDVANTGIGVGSKLPEAAPWSASLFAKVALVPMGVPEVSLSVGIYYVDRRAGADFFSGPFSISPFSTAVRELPPSTRVDLGAFWDVSRRFRLQANLTNLFDTRVYEPAASSFNIVQTRRFTVGGRVTL